MIQSLLEAHSHGKSHAVHWSPVQPLPRVWSPVPSRDPSLPVYKEEEEERDIWDNHISKINTRAGWILILYCFLNQLPVLILIFAEDFSLMHIVMSSDRLQYVTSFYHLKNFLIKHPTYQNYAYIFQGPKVWNWIPGQSSKYKEIS